MRPAGVLCLSYSGAEQITEASICSDLSPASWHRVSVSFESQFSDGTRIGSHERTLADTDYRDLCHILLLVRGLDAAVIWKADNDTTRSASEINESTCKVKEPNQFSCADKIPPAPLYKGGCWTGSFPLY